MGGTGENIERDARTPAGRPRAGGEDGKAEQDMRCGEHVTGDPTVEVMRKSGVTALGVDAGRTLLFDRKRLIEGADAGGIAIEAFVPEIAAQAPRPASAAEGSD